MSEANEQCRRFADLVWACLPRDVEIVFRRLIDGFAEFTVTVGKRRRRALHRVPYKGIEVRDGEGTLEDLACVVAGEIKRHHGLSV